MNILFIHQNFPGQFKHLAPALARLGHKVTALKIAPGSSTTWNNVLINPYQLERGNGKDTHPLARDLESKLIRAEACFHTAKKLRDTGYYPDIIIAHPGWGETLFLKEIWPDSLIKIYCEFYYHAEGYDVGFDPEFPTTEFQRIQIRLKNINNSMQFELAHSALSPTKWQASTYPKWFRDKITVVHDGIDTQTACPNEKAVVKLPNGKLIDKNSEVITFVNRSLEPYRGFHTFMRALPLILASRPHAEVIVIGGEGVSYGAKPSYGNSWKDVLLEEIKAKANARDWNRVHFVGNVPYNEFLATLQVSTVHVYLTYPFVLSWSLLEAMSVGCAIVASDTAPVRELITHESEGILWDFFDFEGLAQSVSNLMEAKELRVSMGERARKKIINQYDLNSICLPLQIDWATTRETHDANSSR